MQVLIILGCLAVAQCAPTEQVAAAEAPKEATQQDVNAKATPPLREFLILTPEAQLQLQPALKLQQPMIQPITLFGSSGSKRQYDAICSQIQTGIGGIYEIFTSNLPWEDQGDGSGSKDALLNQQLEGANAEAQSLPLAILPKISATEHPVAVQHRFYTIAGQPHFFTNEAIIQPPLQPIYSIPPLQAIKARSVSDPMNAILQEGDSPNLISQNSEGLPLALPLQTNDNIPMEQLQASENAARSFASGLEEKKQEEAAAINAVAEQFANRFGAEQVPESLKEDSENPILDNVDLKPGVAAAKSVDFVEPKELVEAESANVAELQSELQNASLEQQQAKLAQDESGNAVVQN